MVSSEMMLDAVALVAVALAVAATAVVVGAGAREGGRMAVNVVVGTDAVGGGTWEI